MLSSIPTIISKLSCHWSKSFSRQLIYSCIASKTVHNLSLQAKKPFDPTIYLVYFKIIFNVFNYTLIMCFLRILVRGGVAPIYPSILILHSCLERKRDDLDELGIESLWHVADSSEPSGYVIPWDAAISSLPRSAGRDRG